MRTVLLLAVFVMSGLAFAAPEKPPAMPTKRPPDPEVGQRIYNQSCWQCHGERGLGDGPAAAAVPGGVPPLAVKGEKDFDKLIDVIQDGRGRMPAYAEDIDKHDSRRILIFVKDMLEGRMPGQGLGKGAGDDEAEKPEAGGAEGAN